MPPRAMESSNRLRPHELAQHREFLCRLAQSLLRDAAGAEDVVHGAFALALARPPRDPQGLTVWLRTVVRRLALNLRREEGRRRAREEAAALLPARGRPARAELDVRVGRVRGARQGDGRSRSDPLRAEGRGHVRADGMGDACVPVEVRPREEARVRVQLEPGSARTLSFPSADPGAGWESLKVSVRSSDGELVAVARLPVPLDDSHAVLVHVPAGRFTVEAETDTGLAARGTFTVLAGTEQDSELAFELR